MNALDHYTIQTNPGTFKVHNEKKRLLRQLTHNEFAAFVHCCINLVQLQAQGLDHKIATNSNYWSFKVALMTLGSKRAPLHTFSNSASIWERRAGFSSSKNIRREGPT